MCIEKNHFYYKSFGVDSDGNAIDFVTRKPIEINPEDRTIRVRGYHNKQRTFNISVFIWECFNGQKPKRTTIVHIDGNEDNNKISNLKLRNGYKRKYLSEEERRLINNANKKRWNHEKWTCPECQKTMKNNARNHHKIICLKRDEENSQRELLKKKDRDNNWRHRHFNCPTCGNKYKNYYKSTHTRLCANKLMK